MNKQSNAFTQKDIVEVSNDNKEWFKRLYIGTTINGFFVAEEVYGSNPFHSLVSSWKFCRPVKEQVTYYVYREIETGLLYTYNGKGGVGAQHCELIHSFTI